MRLSTTEKIRSFWNSPAVSTISTKKLMSIGCPIAPGRIPLTDNEDDALRVKLYSRIEMGNHLIRILSEQNTLADANTLTFVVLNVSDDIKLKLGEKIAKDQYVSIPEIVADIRQMTYDAGPIKRTFYCPLVVQGNKAVQCGINGAGSQSQRNCKQHQKQHVG